MLDRDFDWSMMSKFHNCHRRYYYTYVLDRQRIKKPGTYLPAAMEFGSAIDDALDIMYQMFSLNKTEREVAWYDCIIDAHYEPERFKTLAFMMGRKNFIDMWGDVTNKGFSKDKGLEILDEYQSRYLPEQFDIVDSQVAGVVPVATFNGEEIYLRGKLDAIIYGYDPNRYSILETKTNGLYKEIFWLAMEMSFQTDGYALMAEYYLDKTIHSCCLNAIHTKVKQDRLERKPILYGAQRRKNYRTWLSNTLQDIMRLQEATWNKYGHFGDNIHEACMNATLAGGEPQSMWLENRQNCTAYMRECPYRELCETNVSPGALSHYEQNTWRPFMLKEK
jgi:hypothetical protein